MLDSSVEKHKLIDVNSCQDRYRKLYFCSFWLLGDEAQGLACAKALATVTYSALNEVSKPKYWSGDHFLLYLQLLAQCLPLATQEIVGE